MAANRWIGNYYVGASGAMYVSRYTPDGYYVDSDGVWMKLGDDDIDFDLDRVVTKYFYMTVPETWDEPVQYGACLLYTSIWGNRFMAALTVITLFLLLVKEDSKVTLVENYILLLGAIYLICMLSMNYRAFIHVCKRMTIKTLNIWLTNKELIQKEWIAIDLVSVYKRNNRTLAEVKIKDNDIVLRCV